jgi:hypothetical protein
MPAPARWRRAIESQSWYAVQADVRRGVHDVATSLLDEDGNERAQRIVDAEDVDAEQPVDVAFRHVPRDGPPGQYPGVAAHEADERNV